MLTWKYVRLNGLKIYNSQWIWNRRLQCIHKVLNSMYRILFMDKVQYCYKISTSKNEKVGSTSMPKKEVYFNFLSTVV